MKEVEKAYLAGLMDGEGSICLLEWTPKETGRLRVLPLIKIGMHSKEAMDFFAKITTRNVYHQDGPKGVWSVQLSYGDAVDFLEAISPYLITKKTQALFFIFFYRIAFGRSYRGTRVPDNIIKFRSIGAKIMRLLNERDSMTFHGKADEFSEQLSLLFAQVKDMSTLSQAPVGTDSGEGATTRETSPNSNSPHERPPLIH